MPSRRRRSGPHARPGHSGPQDAHAARAELAARELAHQERRQAHAAQRQAEAVRGLRIERRHIALAVVGAIGVMAMVAFAFALGPAISAARGEGTKGTFVVGGEACTHVSRGSAVCSWVGTFRGPGGEQVPNVDYDGSLPAGSDIGSIIPAIYPGGDHAVFAPHGSLYWLEDLVLVVVIGGAVAMFLWISPIGSGRRQRYAGPVV
jgi:hypothetical protein